MSRPELGTTRAAQAAGRPGLGGEGAASPYARPIIKPPVWKPEIPFYFYTGGLGGASAGLAFAAGLRGDAELSRRAWALALAGVGASPPLLLSDLGVPSRFLNMLRVFKVTSPMSVGSWLLTAAGGAVGVSALHAWTGLLAGPARVSDPAAALLGMPLSTYTAALVANTAVPAWHEVRHVLPLAFAGGAAASAGAAATIATPVRHAAPARRLTLLGVAAELAGTQLVEQRAGPLKDAYVRGTAGRFGIASKLCGAAGGALVLGAGSRSRAAAIAGGALVTAGAICARWNVFEAGKASASNPDHTAIPQRERITRGEVRGASRRAMMQE